jgi:hypothetical protein
MKIYDTDVLVSINIKSFIATKASAKVLYTKTNHTSINSHYSYLKTLNECGFNATPNAFLVEAPDPLLYCLCDRCSPIYT